MVSGEWVTDMAGLLKISEPTHNSPLTTDHSQLTIDQNSNAYEKDSYVLRCIGADASLL